MPNVDLGLIRDLITSIVRTSGDGSAGTTDTYTIYTISHQTGSGAGQFTVHNGADLSVYTITSVAPADFQTFYIIAKSGLTHNLATLINNIVSGHTNGGAVTSGNYSSLSSNACYVASAQLLCQGSAQYMFEFMKHDGTLLSIYATENGCNITEESL